MEMETLDRNTSDERIPLDDLKGRWTFLTISVVGAVTIAFYYFWAYSMMLGMFSKIPGMAQNYNGFETRHAFGGEFASIMMHLTMSGLLFFMAQVCSVIAVCLFFHRATSNLYKANLEGLTYTPGWAVGWFFIPFVQLVFPFLVSIQLWKGSVSLSRGETDGWKKNPLSPLIILWYAVFIFSILYLIIYSVYIQTSMIRGILDTPFEHPRPEQVFEIMSDLSSKFKMMFFGYCGLWVIQGMALILWTKKVVGMQNGN